MIITIISIFIVVVILAFILFINYDYSTKYKTSEKDLYYEALDLFLAGKLKESYSHVTLFITTPGQHFLFLVE